MHDLDLTEDNKLSVESFITKEGKFSDDLGSNILTQLITFIDEFKGLVPHSSEAATLITELMYANNCVLTSYEYEYDYARIIKTKERVNLILLGNLLHASAIDN